MIRKSIQKILGILLGVIMILMQGFPVFAQELTIHVEYPVGIITNPNHKWAIGLTRPTVIGTNYMCYSQISIAGQKVYCLEPLSFTDDGYGGYTASDLAEYVGNDALTQKLEYISALGYGFEGDRSMEMDCDTNDVSFFILVELQDHNRCIRYISPFWFF